MNTETKLPDIAPDVLVRNIEVVAKDVLGLQRRFVALAKQHCQRDPDGYGIRLKESLTERWLELDEDKKQKVAELLKNLK